MHEMGTLACHDVGRGCVCLELTIRGAFMYPRQAPGDLLTIIATGVLDVSPIHVTSFPLERVNEALEQAAASKGLRYCMLVP